jgi:hypothetical protein
MLYSYLILLVDCLLGYKGAEPAMAIVIITAMLLTLPVIAKDRGSQVLALTGALSAVNGLLFAALVYGIGRGVALLLNA